MLGQLDRLIRITVADQVREQLQCLVHFEDVGRRLVPLDVLVHPDRPFQLSPHDLRTIRACGRNLQRSQQQRVTRSRAEQPFGQPYR